MSDTSAEEREVRRRARPRVTFEEAVSEAKQEAPSSQGQTPQEPPAASQGAPGGSNDSKRALPRLHPLALLGGGLVFTVALSFGVVHEAIPRIQEASAAQELSRLTEARGAVGAQSRFLTSYQGTTVPGTNPLQKALSTTPGGEASPALVFSNGRTDPKRRVVSLYLDLSTGGSQDILLMNRSMLTSLMETGALEIRVHLVPTKRALGTLAAEAVAEASYTAPSKAWNLLFEVARYARGTQATAPGVLAQELAQVVRDAQVSGVDARSLQNGTFASWLLSQGQDPRLKTGVYPPLVYRGETLVDSKTVNLNASDSLKKELLK